MKDCVNRSHFQAREPLRQIALAVVFLGCAVSAACPCSDSQLCIPLPAANGPPRREVFAFHLSPTADWPSYDWAAISTVSLFGEMDDQLYCYAHSIGVRVVRTVFYTNYSSIGEMAARLAWVQLQKSYVSEHGLDGINFDLENFKGNSADMTALVQETVSALRSVNPAAQVSFDCTIHPEWHVEHYNFSAIATESDFLVA
jgi:Di-N-acetylchitobiase